VILYWKFIWKQLSFHCEKLSSLTSGSRLECRCTPGCHLQNPGVTRANTFLIYYWKDNFKMSPNLKPSCYGFATTCRILYFSFAGWRKPEKVGKPLSSTVATRVQMLFGLTSRSKPAEIVTQIINWCTPVFLITSTKCINWSIRYLRDSKTFSGKKIRH